MKQPTESTTIDALPVDRRGKPTTPHQRYRRRLEREKDIDPVLWVHATDDEESTDQEGVWSSTTTV
jgi:hypothetical protein